MCFDESAQSSASHVRRGGHTTNRGIGSGLEVDPFAGLVRLPDEEARETSRNAQSEFIARNMVRSGREGAEESAGCPCRVMQN